MKNIRKIFGSLKNPQVRKTAGIIVGILLILGGIFYYFKTQNRVSIEDSLVYAPVISIAPANPGKLQKLYVNVGNQVKQGDVIAQVDDQTLRADADGVIIQTNDVVGGIISTQSPVAEMIRTSQLRIDGTIDENKGLDQIKVGQPVSFTIDAYPGKTYWGYVDQISATAKQTQLAFSISNERPTQQFDIFAKFDPAQYPELKNGMSAKMTVFTKTP